MDFKNLFTTFAIVSLMVLAIFSFVISTQSSNNSANLITNNSIINDTYGNLYGNVSEFQASSDTASGTFGIAPPTSTFGIVDVASITGTTRIFRALTTGVYNILIQLPMKILGVPAIVVGLIDAIILLLIILGIWAIWRGVAS